MQRVYPFALALVTVASLGSAAILAQSQPAPPKGFTAAFNGKDLSGWEGDADLWRVEEKPRPGAALGKCRQRVRRAREVVADEDDPCHLGTEEPQGARKLAP